MKVEKRVTVQKKDSEPLEKPKSSFLPSHPFISKIQTQYPRLYNWDKMQQQKVKMGMLSKEEYLKVREENFAEALDQEI